MPVQQVLTLVRLMLPTQALLAQGIALSVLLLQPLLDITKISLQGLAVLFEAVQMLLSGLPGLHREAFGELAIQRLGFPGQRLAMLEQMLTRRVALAFSVATPLLLSAQLTGGTLFAQHPQWL
jgi:hypothetical protein